MSIKLGGVRLRAGFLFAAFLAFVLNGGGADAGLLFCSALAHELGHILALRRFGVRELTLRLHPGGASIGGAGIGLLPYRRALAAALAGPAVNAGIAAVCAALPLFGVRAASLGALRDVNLALCGCNLLPLSFLDGGAALFCLRAVRGQGVPAASRRVDAVCLLALFCVCAFLLAARRPAPFVLAFTGYCFVYSLLAKPREV